MQDLAIHLDHALPRPGVIGGVGHIDRPATGSCQRAALKASGTPSVGREDLAQRELHFTRLFNVLKDNQPALLENLKDLRADLFVLQGMHRNARNSGTKRQITLEGTN